MPVGEADALRRELFFQARMMAASDGVAMTAAIGSRIQLKACLALAAESARQRSREEPSGSSCSLFCRCGVDAPQGRPGVPGGAASRTCPG